MCWSGFGTEKWLKLVMDFMYFTNTALVDFFFFFWLKSNTIQISHT